MKQRKQLDIELMRILASFFVIFNHSDWRGFGLFLSYDPRAPQFWLYQMVSVFCKFSVPLFFAITGALMLHRNPEPLRKLWKNRVLKMCLLLLAWSFFYYCAGFNGVSFEEHDFNLKNFAMQFYDSNWNFSFWFLYAYIPLLMTLPILQYFVKAGEEKSSYIYIYIYIFALVFAFTAILPTVQYLLWQDRHNLNENFRVNWLAQNIFFYPMLGHFLQHKVSWTKKKVIAAWIANIATILISCYMMYLKMKVSGVFAAETFVAGFVMVNCIAIWGACKYLFVKIKLPAWLEKLIESMGGCTLGIYLLHIFFIARFGTAIWRVVYALRWNRMVSALVYCGIIFMLGYLTTLLLKRIPILNKILL